MKGIKSAWEQRKQLEDAYSKIHERHQHWREYQRLLDVGHKLLSQIQSLTEVRARVSSGYWVQYTAVVAPTSGIN
jgi:hypothetical protein